MMCVNMKKMSSRNPSRLRAIAQDISSLEKGEWGINNDFSVSWRCVGEFRVYVVIVYVCLNLIKDFIT